MSMEKIAITLPPEQLQAAKRAVEEGRASSVSAYISAALARAQREDSLAHIVADIIATEGHPSAEDYAWADRGLGISDAKGAA